jgi:hypothetical protein
MKEVLFPVVRERWHLFLVHSIPGEARLLWVWPWLGALCASGIGWGSKVGKSQDLLCSCLVKGSWPGVELSPEQMYLQWEASGTRIQETHRGQRSS